MSKVVKVKIPVALREQVWITYFGKKYEHKCYVRWCQNNIDVFNFQVGHNIPESRGGHTLLENLRPICIRCNQSMSNVYTIDEWNKFGNPRKSLWSRFNSCLCSITGNDSKPKNLSH
jgi:5-methylcytosine-specific restriction endonuclease McrA